MILRLLYQYWFKAMVIALIALLLFGVFSGTHLASILVLFVVIRFWALASEALRTAVPHGRIRGALPARPQRELLAEALGVVAFAILIPLDIALYSRDFFSLRMPQGWAGAAVGAACLALYGWPHRRLKAPDDSDLRIWWWVLPFALGLLALTHGIGTRHPYLNPFNPDHTRLAALRALALKNNVVAGYHADWVLRYARQLDEQGQTQQAIQYYRAGLRLDASNHEVAARLARLEPESSSPAEPKTLRPAATGPYWTAARPVLKQPRHAIDSQLENVPGCTVIVLAAGDVPEALLDAVAYVIHNELELPVYVSPEVVPLPPHTRVRGLATGPQWDESAIVRAFTNTITVFPHAPIRYLLVTPADIYTDEANYVVSTTYAWGGLVSSFRFRDANDDRVRHDTAKQSLCALLKSFNLPPSADRNCVTSYARSVEEFYAKGDRPDAETLKSFQKARTILDDTWRHFRRQE